MDPQKAWIEMLRSWTDREWLEVAEYARALLEWLARDGFPPKTTPIGSLGNECHRKITRTVARHMLRRATSVLEDANGIPAEVAFSLSCAECCDEGPDQFDAATQQGWTGIEYTPAGLSENFLGRCPKCSRSD
ncbi:hypothetical protein Poly51_17490 [Rubripirellula tenax]|uniref:Uncharacterized protein n=1 Tax=Rubripirellula tenax TaxID=2528015 RepID=A0A5C6FC11_9BACT|nr:hypothetical protein [Rubripirellula tenax]TWU58968.1 hypothetical protein Poly51_17490 [Rubripirellula tenax]